MGREILKSDRYMGDREGQAFQPHSVTVLDPLALGELTQLAAHGTVISHSHYMLYN